MKRGSILNHRVWLWLLAGVAIVGLSFHADDRVGAVLDVAGIGP